VGFEEFDHRGIRFIRVQDKVDTDSPITIIGAMAELESSLISLASGHRQHEGSRGSGKASRPPASAPCTISEIETIAASTDLSVRQIQKEIAGEASGSVVGAIAKRIRAGLPPAL
jgi:hypothetical protein